MKDGEFWALWRAGALSTWATENSWRARPYTTFIFPTRPAYCKDQQGRCRPRPYTVCDVINFSAQRQLLEEQEIFQIMPRLQVNLFLQIWKFFYVFSIYSLQVSSFMYLYHNDALPVSFTQIFQTGNQTHQYSTRYSDFYRPQTCRTNFKKISIRSQGPRIWNSLPNNIKNAPTFNIFKRVIEPFLRVRQDTT